MVNKEATYKLFRPDLENPTAEDFKAATAGINALPIPWVKLLRTALMLVSVLSSPPF